MHWEGMCASSGQLKPLGNRGNLPPGTEVEKPKKTEHRDPATPETGTVAK